MVGGITLGRNETHRIRDNPRPFPGSVEGSMAIFPSPYRSVLPFCPILLGLVIGGCQKVADPGTTTADPTAVRPPLDEATPLASPKGFGETYRRGAVAADSRIASDAGVEIMTLGGNAVDAAVATGFTLCVSRPYSCGIGGGGFMLIHDPSTGESHCLDFRETSPSGVGPAYYPSLAETPSGYDPSLYGGRAVGIPGQIPGLLAAHERFGSLPLATVLAPAIRAAEEGVEVDPHYRSAIGQIEALRRRHPDLRPASNWIWRRLCLEGREDPNERVLQPALGRFLRRLAADGVAAWSGPDGVADLVAGVDRAWDGVLTASDIRDYRPVWREPLIVPDIYEDVDAVLMPPPSSGGIALAQIITIVDRAGPAFGDPSPDDPEYAELLVAAFRHAFADRARHLADPDFVEVPVEALLDRDRLDEIASELRPGEVVSDEACGVLPAPAATVPPDDRGTSHFSVIDANGMTVACTQTINGTFGSLIAVPDIGVVLNNEMNDFTTRSGDANLFGLTQSDRNAPEPGKRPLSSMSPTILLRDGRTVATAGASGGPRIITGVAQVLLRHLATNEESWDAIAAPRIHHQWSPDVVRHERSTSPWNPRFETLEFELRPIDSVGIVQAIFVDETGLKPASDPRKGGAAAGW